jgi:tricorn protease
MKPARLVALSGWALTLTAGTALAVDTHDTRLLSQPAVSASHIAFIYDADLWIAEADGSSPRRLTTAEGVESNPAFSPDGSLIAFSGDYDGNVDVYLMPVAGGAPTRLTWHPQDDIVRSFTPDGSAVLFQSQRSVATRRHHHLYLVPIEGGAPRRLPIPTGTEASFSPDGKRIAYVPIAGRFSQWKGYRGGTTSRIWLMDLDDQQVVQVPQPEGRCNDTDPMWVGERVYFASDRDGELNLFSFDPATGAVEPLTHHQGFPVVNASAGAGRIIYEQEGWLHTFDIGSRSETRLRVGVGADLREARGRWAKGAKWVRNLSLAPDGKRVAVEFRGEIVTVPAEKGDPRNITHSPGAHDRSPAWSPDGKQIAYFSDAGGEYGLLVAAQDGTGEPRRYPLTGAGFYGELHWSPDGKHIALQDNSLSLFVLDLASGRLAKVAQEPVYSPMVTLTSRWSDDSRWLAYTLNTAGLFQTVYVYSMEEGRSFAISDGMSEMSEPAFDPNGKYLYMLGSTDAGPVKDWFAQSTTDMPITHTIYAAVLDKEAPSPIPPQSDEVGTEDAKGDDEKAGDKKATEKNEAAAGPTRVRIDFEGLADRIVPLPVTGATLRNLRVGKSGELYYLESRGFAKFEALQAPSELKRFTLEEREPKSLGKDVLAFEISQDKTKVLVSRKEQWVVAELGKELEAGKGQLRIDDVSVRVEPREEWPQIFAEAWRINRDYFYAPNYHGADWPAVRAKYEPFVAHAATRADLERIIRWMASELSVGHSYSREGETIEEPKKVSVGLLGADYEIAEGRYRFAKVYGGLNWTPDLRSPLVTPGVEVQAGEYLLAVNGVDVTPPENLYRRFENTADRQVKITVGPHADGRDSREVTVVPVGNEADLRYRDWVEGNQRKVDAATGGRVAYVHVPDTADRGYQYFRRYFYPQSYKQAIIVDERFNGGGLIADYYIDILRRPFIANWAMRYGRDLVSPRGAIFGPKVMIIDETAGSGGDLLPWMFRKYELGPLVGRRTWGGLVGILGFPVLMDGGGITAPNLAIWSEEGWVVENQGVPPDVEVEQWPAEVNAGRDPQLEKAIELTLDALEKNPPRELTRPDYPVRGLR